jgi:putative chitinase
MQLDTTGAIVSREEYYPFGETSYGSYGKKRYRFCGKEKDEESGLYYYGMRYYSAWTCRFMSVDPLAAKYPFYTPYQYAGNKPIIAVDIDGLEDNATIGQNGNNATANQSKPKEVKQSNNGANVKIKVDLRISAYDNGSIPDIAIQTGAFSYQPKQQRQTVGADSKSNYTVTKENLKEIFPQAKNSVLDQVVPLFNKYLSEYGINSDLRMALFLSQVGHESKGFQKTSVTESTYYTTEERLEEIFPKYFTGDNAKDASDYIKNSEKLANLVYGNRLGNGAESTGEGYKFRGRGLMQLTGKDNYQAFTDFYNKKYNKTEDFVENPDKISDNVELSVISSLWYFQTRVINAQSYKVGKKKIEFNIDKLDLKGVTRLVNGGLIGYDPERMEIFSKAKKVLGF